LESSGTTRPGKRRKLCADETASAGERWYVVMFIRERKSGEGSEKHGEKEHLRSEWGITQHICTLLLPRPSESGKDDRRRVVDNGGVPRLKIVLALGPVSSGGEAERICQTWTATCRKGVIPRAAKGEAVSIVYGVPGFVDWDAVFGSESELRQKFEVETRDDPLEERVATTLGDRRSQTSRRPPGCNKQ